MFKDGEIPPSKRADIFKHFKTTDKYTKDFKSVYPNYRGTLPHRFTTPADVVDDMLHAKLHFAEFAVGFVAPLIEEVEDLHEGHSTVNYAMALERSSNASQGKALA